MLAAFWVIRMERNAKNLKDSSNSLWQTIYYLTSLRRGASSDFQQHFCYHDFA